MIRRFHWYKYKPTRVNVDFVCEPFRSQCHCPWICLFGHFYSRSRGKEQIAALLASVMSFRKLRFVRQACLESMTNYVIRSAGRSPVLPQVTLKGWQKTWCCYGRMRAFLYFLNIVVAFRCGWGKMEMFAFLPPSLQRTSRVVVVWDSGCASCTKR